MRLSYESTSWINITLEDIVWEMRYLILPNKRQNVYIALRKRAVILSIARHPSQVYVQRDSRGIQILRSHGSGIFPYAVTIQVACLWIELLESESEVSLHPSKSLEFADARSRSISRPQQ